MLHLHLMIAMKMCAAFSKFWTDFFFKLISCFLLVFQTLQQYSLIFAWHLSTSSKFMYFIKVQNEFINLKKCYGFFLVYVYI